MSELPWLSSNFLTAQATLETAQVALLGAPYDSTTSFRPGTRYGPAALRAASYGIESYSPELDRDLEELQICDLGDLELPFGRPERAFDVLRAGVEHILAQNVMPVVIGGEHSLTYPCVKAVAKKYPGLHVIVFDAHCDLREEYLAEPFSHASVMRRCCDVLGTKNVHQFGIRSGTREEYSFARENFLHHPYTPESLREVLQKIGDAPIYFSMDLDVHDPAVFPGTGTPEPGGVFYPDTIKMFQQFAGKNIVAVDWMELSPHYDTSGCSAVLAAKLLRELLLTID
ncbi:MAG: agmatinase [bacterium]|nr:agmatinase [bacterium]